MNWYTRITQNLGVIPDFITHYEAELITAKQEVKIYGNVEKNIAAIPGVTEHRFNQLQEIEAVLNYLNIQLRKIRRKHFQKYLEAYNRALTSRDAEKYAEGEDEAHHQIEVIAHRRQCFLRQARRRAFMRDAPLDEDHRASIDSAHAREALA